ncbi:MAG TPA: hypothetical protein VGD27_04545 [Longimicrobiales bacterium]
MRTVRRLSQIFLTLSGTATVIYAVARVEPLRERLLVAALGLIVMELGIWQITRVFFPNEREFKPLREETDYFLKLVRRLNALTLRLQQGSSTAQGDIDRLRDEMLHSVERMCRLAGRTEEEMALSTMKTSWRPRSPFRREKAVARSAESLQEARS